MLMINSNLKRGVAVFFALLLALSVGGQLQAADHGEEKAPAAEKSGHDTVEQAGDHDASPVRAEVSGLKKFQYSWLTAYMFFFSICLGALFLVLLHHLFDAQWIVPIRRVCEHIACMLGWPMFILFLPIFLYPIGVYDWMSADPMTDPGLRSFIKQKIFNLPGFYFFTTLVFVALGYLSSRLRYWSLQQDVAEAENGAYEGKVRGFWEPFVIFVSTNILKHDIEERPAVKCSRMMNLHTSYGIVLFVMMMTVACFAWVKALQYQWFSTMYGVYFFAGSVWVTCATVYMLTLLHQSQGLLQYVVRRETYHDIAKLMFAFTVFYAYIHFSQYFLILNAAIPEETFWYVQREQGSWWWIGQTIIFGHFFLPFLLLLRTDVKTNKTIMPLICGWAWLMHYVDMQFNVMPLIYPEGISISWRDVIAMGVIGFVLWLKYNSDLSSHAPYPQRDPRIAESMGVYVEPEGGEPAAH
ncbi:MAG: hypothetical protein ACJASX_001322 [Limisphaerales bacterium]|jgi:hypothetical protein